MGRFAKGQQVIIKDTGEIKSISHETEVNGLWSMTDGNSIVERLFVPLSGILPWQQNTILDVGAKSLKELPAADKAARIANRAIERMINQ